MVHTFCVVFTWASLRQDFSSTIPNYTLIVKVISSSLSTTCLYIRLFFLSSVLFLYNQYRWEVSFLLGPLCDDVLLGSKIILREALDEVHSVMTRCSYLRKPSHHCLLDVVHSVMMCSWYLREHSYHSLLDVVTMWWRLVVSKGAPLSLFTWCSPLCEDAAGIKGITATTLYLM